MRQPLWRESGCRNVLVYFSTFNNYSEAQIQFTGLPSSICAPTSTSWSRLRPAMSLTTAETQTASPQEHTHTHTHTILHVLAHHRCLFPFMKPFVTSVLKERCDWTRFFFSSQASVTPWGRFLSPVTSNIGAVKNTLRTILYTSSNSSFRVSWFLYAQLLLLSSVTDFKTI